MLRSFGFALLAATTALVVGCAAEPVADESEGSTTSHVTKGSDETFFSRLEEKTQDCNLLSDSETAKLGAMVPPMFSFSAEVFVYFKCSVEAGEVVTVSASMESRAGWSTTDGAFTEEAVTATTKVSIPVRVVTLSGSVATATTVRVSQNVGLTKDTSSSMSVGVTKNLGIVKVGAQATFDGTQGSISGNVEAPLIIPISACTGMAASVGAKLKLSAEANHWDENAKRANDILLEDRMNQMAAMKDEPTYDPEFGHDVCCRMRGCE